MKANIHPKYNSIQIKCSCGASFTSGSTQDNIAVDICSKCHPFFTGEMRFVDTMGRVEKYKAKQAGALAEPKKKKNRGASQTGPQTLSDIRASS